jgi:beta-keto acid cleavage enzyme
VGRNQGKARREPGQCLNKEAGAAAYHKVIITCAVTGAIHTPSMSPHLPITPEEMTAAPIGAAEAGSVGGVERTTGYPGAQIIEGLGLEVARSNERARECDVCVALWLSLY